MSDPPESSPAPIEQWEVLDLLTSLVQKSLVVYEEDEHGQGRFRLLETVRQYARDRLLEAGGGTAVRTRHLAFFLHWAEQGPDWERTETEHDNLRAALEWSGAPGQGEVGLRLGWALWWFWLVRGYWTEGRERLAGLLALPGAEARTLARAHALHGAGGLARLQGDYGAARALYEESLAIFRELENKQWIAYSYRGLGWTAHDQGDCAAARALYEESVAMFRALGDKQGTPDSLWRLGSVACDQGDYRAARALLEESLALFRELGDRHGIAVSLGGLGKVAREQGDYEAARALIQESLAILRELGHKLDIAPKLDGLAAVAVAQAQPERAARLCGAAEGLREAIGALLPPVEFAAHDRSVAAARTALGAEAFAAAWAEGRAMPLDDAIRCALEVADA